MKQSDKTRTDRGLPELVHSEKARLIQEICALLRTAGRRELEITLAFLHSLLRK
ncbi:MAG: hypothetical protein IJ960_00725 [Oscillospiraceae bacterium]|nr:hypothetical protein [Oscillospiraceae bacterium]